MKKFRPLKDSYFQKIVDRHRQYDVSPNPVLNLLREVYMPVRVLDPSRRRLVRRTAAAILNGRRRVRRFVRMTESERLAVAMCATEAYFLRMARLQPSPELDEVHRHFWGWLASLDAGHAFLALPTRSSNCGIPAMDVIIRHQLTKIPACVQVFLTIRKFRY